MVRRGVIASIALVLMGFAVGAGPASGQGRPGYPGPTTTTAPGETNEEQNAGTVRAGHTIEVESCGFASASETDPIGQPMVDVTWNGESVGTASVGDDGCARVEISVHDRDGEQPCPVAEVNGRTVAGRRGRNTLVVAGEGANGAPRTVTTRVSITCSSGKGSGGGGGKGPKADDVPGNGDPGSRASNEEVDRATLASVVESAPARWVTLGAGLLAVCLALVSAERVRRARRSRL